MDISTKILSEITVFTKYARYWPELGRRETWQEICERNMAMHIKKYPSLKDEIKDVYEKFVFTKKVLPSMRSLQFGGKPIEISPNRMYNCCYLPVDDYRAFSESMFLLLGGTGVGYSVQKKHIQKLPVINKPTKTRRYLINDSIEGWADSVKHLMEAYMCGKSMPVFDFSDIREKGQPLITSGGKAPGAQPLKDCLHNLQKILDSVEADARLTPLQVHDVMCYIADAVLAGGIRRAALICLFNIDDEEMLTCKFGNWWELNPQRARANNSAVIVRSKVTEADFKNLWDKIKASGSGEPGFYLTDDEDWGCNPCCKPLDSLILTEDGYITFQQALELKKVLKVYTPDGRLVEATKPFKTGSNKEVYALELSNGSILKGTDNHQHQLENGEWVTIADLKVGDKLSARYTNIHENLDIQNQEDYNKGLIAGWIYGDGWLHKRSDSDSYRVGMCFGVDEFDIVPIFEALTNKKAIPHKQKPDTCKVIKLDMSTVRMLIAEGAHINSNLDKNNIQWLYGKSKEFKLGFIRAWFTADGSARKHGVAALYGTTQDSLRALSDIIREFGMYAKFGRRSLAKTRSGNYGVRNQKESFQIEVPWSQFERIGFLSKKKQTTMQQRHKTNSIRKNKMLSSVTVNSIKLSSVEDVYDITVKDDCHAFIDTSVVTHNCEIGLRPYQFCNLVEINAHDIDSQEEYGARAKAAAFISTLQAGYTDFHYIREIWRKTTEKDALIGVSMTGIASGAVLGLDEAAAAKVVLEENARVADLIGINHAARTTCIKPAGCQNPDTMILTDKGLISLGEMGDTAGSQWQNHDFNVAQENAFFKSTKFYINGLVDTKKIQMSSGINLECTPNHQYRVLRGGEYKWSRADQLRSGDILPYQLDMWPELEEIELPTYMKRTDKNKNGAVKRDDGIKSQPVTMNTDFAFLLGMIFGDGSVHKKGIRIAGGSAKIENIIKCQDIVSRLFSINAKIIKDIRKEDSYSLYINSTGFVRFLSQIGCLKQKAKDIEIPLMIRTSPKTVILSFINGYLAADGCKKHKYIDSWSAATTSRKWAEQLTVLSRAVGLDCKFKVLKTGEGHIGSLPVYQIHCRKSRLNPEKHKHNTKKTREIWRQLDLLGLNKFNFDIVENIKDSKCLTYDIEVPENNCYIANSYVSHNTTSCVLGSSSGIHAWHDQYFIRRMRIGKNESIYKYLSANHPELVEDEYFKPHLEAVVSLPLAAPKGAIFRDESAIDLLERVKRYSENWVKTGHRDGANSHNVSATIYIKSDEWDLVWAWMWENRDYYNGLSVLPHDGGSYKQAPFETCDKETYEKMLNLLKEIDLTQIVEHEDTTNLSAEVACAGGSCEIR